ncbi:hypothetical protein D9M68_767510 [compost metagenome]
MYYLPVEPGSKAKFSVVGHRMGGYEPRSECTRCLEILAGQELTCVFLPVSDAAVVVAAVADYIGHRLGSRYVAALSADDDGEFPFVIEFL